MRYIIELAYDGTHFGGWQVQNNTITVQGEIDKALSQVCNQTIETMGCGRTDAGVHASYFVAHFDGPENIPVDLDIRLNKMLPNSIGIKKITAVNEDFHARFSATARAYTYVLLNSRVRQPLWAGRAGWVFQPLDVLSMTQAAQSLLGEHDFSSFRWLRRRALRPSATLHVVLHRLPACRARSTACATPPHSGKSPVVCRRAAP